MRAETTKDPKNWNYPLKVLCNSAITLITLPYFRKKHDVICS